MTGVEFSPRQAETEQLTVHIIWMTSGLGCDGDTVAMTAATRPSLEDLLNRTLPGMPGVALYNPMLAVESGEDFMRAWYDAEAGRLDPFILVLEGSVPNEAINGDGHWAGLGVDPRTGQPITTNEWIDRLAPRAATVLALGTCATYGGIPAMRNNPTGAMGLRDYLGRSWRSRSGLPIVNLPGCPAQPDNITETLLYLVLQIAGTTQPIELDEQGRPAWLFERTAHEVCNRAGFADHGDYADRLGDDGRCLVKFGCKGPVVRCNVPGARLGRRRRRLPERRRHLHRLHDAGLPRQVPAADGHRPQEQAAGERRPLRLRAAAQAAPQPGDEAPLRARAGVAAARRGAGERLSAVLVTRSDRAGNPDYAPVATEPSGGC